MSHWFYLGLAIVFEVVATTALKATTGFSRLWPSLLVVTGYAGAFYFLSLSLRSVPIGVAYAVWSGAGGPMGRVAHGDYIISNGYAQARGCSNCHTNIHGGNSTVNSATSGRFRR